MNPAPNIPEARHVVEILFEAGGWLRYDDAGSSASGTWP